MIRHRRSSAPASVQQQGYAMHAGLATVPVKHCCWPRPQRKRTYFQSYSTSFLKVMEILCPRFTVRPCHCSLATAAMPCSQPYLRMHTHPLQTACQLLAENAHPPIDNSQSMPQILMWFGCTASCQYCNAHHNMCRSYVISAACACAQY